MSTPDLNTEIGQRLQAVREKARLSQGDFAERLGLVLRTYASYERGERSLSIEALRALYEEFHVDPVWLLFGPESAPKQSGSSRQRAAILVQIIVSVEQHLEKGRLRLAPDKKARLISLLYEHFLTRGVKEFEDDYVRQALSYSAL